MNKLMVAMEKVYQKIPPKRLDYLFLVAFAMVLVYDYNFLTLFERGPFRVPYMVGAALAGIVLILRFLNLKNENKVDVFFAALILLIGGGYLLVRHSFYFFVLAMLIVGAARVEEKKLLAVYLIVAVLFFLVMLTHFFITTPEWNSGSPVSFGSINTTDCQSMVFFIVVAYLYYKGRHVRYIILALFGVTVLLFWYFTKAQINMYCTMACLIFTVLAKCNNNRRMKYANKPRQVIGLILSASFLICAIVMIFLVIHYDPDDEKWQMINRLLHRRMEIPSRMIKLYPPSLWGSEFQQIGQGSQPGVSHAKLRELVNQYGFTYIDCSYLNILVNHGYIISALIMGIMTFLSVRNALRGDLFRVLLLSVIAVDCAAEGHLKEISCNVWLLLPLTRCNDSMIQPNVSRTELEGR